MHLTATLLAALEWDPQIRGALIVIAAILILPGSVYLLLATNTGARLGFLLAVAGLSGWMAVMGIVWMVFGIGLKGREPSWKPKELITGSLINRTTVDAMGDYPTGWKELKTGNARLGDATAAADRVFAPSAGGAGHGAESSGPSPEEQARFKSPFSSTSDYKLVDAYETGGDNEVFTIGKHKFYFRHSPHYVTIRVAPVIPNCSASVTTNCVKLPASGPAPDPQIDPSKPVTTLTMVRDLGSLRFPPFLIALSSLLVFGVTCSALHERDKEIMRLRAQGATA